jgi:hemolysin activation/secretion protein
MTTEATIERIYIRQYVIKGARHLTRVAIEEAVYPYLGPGRTKDDVEKARAALEREYQEQGYQTVAVQVPEQPWQDGNIVLEVTATPVGRLRVQGARYFLPSQIKEMAPALAEGEVLNFNAVNRDVIALNQYSDLRVTPSLRAGATPGTVDVDLTVKDTFPLHGNLELNNRYSPNTTQLRLDGAISYDNLWQRGHSIGGSFQLSPMDISEVQVYSGYYLARFPDLTWLSLRVSGTDQNSAVATVGGLASAGAGTTIAMQSIFVLPGSRTFYHSLRIGVDYKNTDQDVGPTGQASSNTTTTSYYYFPISATYSATWMQKKHQTELVLAPTFSFPGWGSSATTFESSRYGCDGSFFYLRGDLSHTRDLPKGLQVYGKIQGQVADKPLPSAEQFGLGGMNTARGYLAGEVFGDNAISGMLELRSPSLFNYFGNKDWDWRFYVFGEVALLTSWDSLPEQKSAFYLADFGIGSSIRLWKHFNGSFDLGVPVISQTETKAYDVLFTFRLWGEF